MRVNFIIILIFISFLSTGQQIQWASKIDFVYNEFSSSTYAGSQALGAPNATPFGSLNPNAFRLKKEKEFGTLVVEFKNPQPATKVIIVESNAPGRIVDVTLFDEKNKRYPAYNAKPKDIGQTFRLLTLDIAQTNYNVKKIEINLNSVLAPGWCQIDAIGISNASDDVSFQRALGSIGLTDVTEEKSFSSEKENLGDNINSPYAESKPIISPDGKKLWFSRHNAPENIGGTKDEQDIYYADLVNGEWSKAKNLGKPLNNKEPNGVSATTPDGNTLLLLNDYHEDPDKPNNGLSITYRDKGGWSTPQSLEISNFLNKNIFIDHYLANNGKVLLLALEDDTSLGDQDLYVSFYSGDNSWSMPRNMGSIINTAGAEFSPFLAADGKTLYFASEGHNGLGGSDIYYSKRLDDTWTNWSKPKNLGSSVNTAGWDAYYTISAKGDYAYFVSTDGANSGSKDIYRIGLPKEFRPDPVVLVAGKVYNAKTNAPIESKIVFESLPRGKEEGIARSNPHSGEYKIVLPSGHLYGYMAKAKGFFSLSENINLKNISQYKEIQKDLYLTPIEIGQIVTMNNLFFERGKAELQEESYPELDRLYQLLMEYPNMEIELRGHTDNRGLAKLNYQLSLDRVTSVKKYLVDQGIAGRRLLLKGFGGTKPIGSNASEETRKLNRRVEIKILNF